MQILSCSLYFIMACTLFLCNFLYSEPIVYIFNVIEQDFHFSCSDIWIFGQREVKRKEKFSETSNCFITSLDSYITQSVKTFGNIFCIVAHLPFLSFITFITYPCRKFLIYPKLYANSPLLYVLYSRMYFTFSLLSLYCVNRIYFQTNPKRFQIFMFQRSYMYEEM